MREYSKYAVEFARNAKGLSSQSRHREWLGQKTRNLKHDLCLLLVWTSAGAPLRVVLTGILRADTEKFPAWVPEQCCAITLVPVSVAVTFGFYCSLEYKFYHVKFTGFKVPSTRRNARFCFLKILKSPPTVYLVLVSLYHLLLKMLPI